MERESFSDPEVAELLNNSFVCIKVDREERPDIDAVYMAACQMLTGSGGWPLTVVMTPQKEPFWAGTYIPKQSRFGIAGLTELIPIISELWKHQRYRAVSLATSVVEALNQPAGIHSVRSPSISSLERCYEALSTEYDEEHGGFGEAPKFPSPHKLLFLLRYWKRTGNTHALKMVEDTLEEMRKGGINDQLGGGFHRYSTDRKWLTPHFEKMLYDQATLLIAYTEAYQATGNPRFSDTVKAIAEYVLRDLTSPDGAFYSAEDADSEGSEGKFYLWKLEDLEKELGEDSNAAAKLFDVTPIGNFHETPAANILHIDLSETQLAEMMDITSQKASEKILTIRKKLLEARSRRVRPLLDDKVITDWNGLMISAFAKAGVTLKEKMYIDAAERAASFIEDKLSKGGLKHRYFRGEASIKGFLDDYAYLTWGLIELFQATFKTKYLKQAIQLSQTALENFWDNDFGGFYIGSSDSDQVTRTKDVYDGAKPSGNSVMALNLLLLSRITGDQRFEEAAAKLFTCFASNLDANPSAYTFLLSALDYALGPSYEVVIAGEEPNGVSTMIEALRESYNPNKVLLLKTPELDEITGFTKDMKAVNGEVTVYVCEGRVCNLPTNDVKKALKKMKGGRY